MEEWQVVGKMSSARFCMNLAKILYANYGVSGNMLSARYGLWQHLCQVNCNWPKFQPRNNTMNS